MCLPQKVQYGLRINSNKGSLDDYTVNASLVIRGPDNLPTEEPDYSQENSLYESPALNVRATLRLKNLTRGTCYQCQQIQCSAPEFASGRCTLSDKLQAYGKSINSYKFIASAESMSLEVPPFASNTATAHRCFKIQNQFPWICPTILEGAQNRNWRINNGWIN